MPSIDLATGYNRDCITVIKGTDGYKKFENSSESVFVVDPKLKVDLGEGDFIVVFTREIKSDRVKERS